MGTRAVYSFIDEKDTFHVYKHWDGYPTGAIEFIDNALPYAWTLPRFEAMEFSASFIAGNKSKNGGDVYITDHWQNHGDLEYRYEITLKDKKLWIKIFEKTYPSRKYNLYDMGFLDDLKKKYLSDEYKAVVNG
jgi:hypothetical protein